MTITLTVAGRIATVDATTHVVAGNTYPVALSLDSEWTGSLYLRVRFGSLYYDIPFASSDTSVDVQMPVGYPEVGIGVFSEALEICTNEARVRLLRSILEAGEQVVEFDSDLYDQWAGEVTTLLTDDAFDAESTRPVQNAVLTAWKDTVPLDSALVHKTGNEAVAGVKTFTNTLVSKGSDLDRLLVGSTVPYGTAGGRSRIVMEGLGEGGNTIRYGLIEIQQETTGANARNSLFVTCRSLDGASYTQASLWKLADGTTRVLIPAHTPVDSGGNPLAPSAQEAINSSMLAVDPRVVHTTGTETIAGEKTHNARLNVRYDVPVFTLRSTKANTATGFKATIGFYDEKDGALSGIGEVGALTEATCEVMRIRTYRPNRTTFYDHAIRAYSDHMLETITPYYPVDGQGNPTPLDASAVMTSGNVAVDPRIVHTTGNQTIAGNKTFSGTLNAPKIRSASVEVQMEVNTWYKMYTLTPVSVGQQIFLEIFNTSSISSMVDAKLRIQVPNANWPYDPAGNLFNVGSILVGKLAKTADGKLEVWLCKVSGSTQYILLNAEYLDFLVPTPVGTAGNEPVQGDDYPLVKNITVIS